MYCEHGSNNRSGGFNQISVKNKSIPCLAIPGNRPKCLVYLLDIYLSKLPQFAFQNDVFYCRPKTHCHSSDESAWYESVPVGKNKLGAMVSNICETAEIARKTLHTTGATSLFQNSVPEHLIQKTTGHRSLKALRVYQNQQLISTWRLQRL
jgi:hypothetical protein